VQMLDVGQPELIPDKDPDFRAVPEGTDVDEQGRVKDKGKIVHGYGSMNIYLLARGKWVGVNDQNEVDTRLSVDV